MGGAAVCEACKAWYVGGHGVGSVCFHKALRSTDAACAAGTNHESTRVLPCMLPCGLIKCESILKLQRVKVVLRVCCVCGCAGRQRPAAAA
jgi:hypothetical protein